MYGQGHRFCENCGHAVRSGRMGCGSCGTPWADLMMLDFAFDDGYAQRDGIGFDPLDGQFAFDIPGTDLAIEPDGQVDIDFGGIDFPVF